MLESPIAAGYTAADNEYSQITQMSQIRSVRGSTGCWWYVEFVNMTGPWGQYLRESDKARGWFMRDPVHANERGFQIQGRILGQYFAP